MVNVDIYKKETEQFLQEIKKNKLDILILQRQNDTLCQENNTKIEGLQGIIESTEKELEVNLKESGEKKIDTSAGWCSFRVMPDKWFYDEAEIIAWCKKECVPYYKTVEVVKKAELKKDVLNGVIDRHYVHGIEITPQDPKFNYKLNGGI